MLKPNDEYRDAVEVLELALELRDGSSPVKKASPTKLKNARRVRESLAGMQQPPDCEYTSTCGSFGASVLLPGRGE